MINNQKPPEWWSHNEDSWNEICHCLSFLQLEQQELQDQSNWQPLTLGQTNSNYRLTGIKKNYFVKVVNRSNSALRPTIDSPLLNRILQNKPALALWLVTNHFESPQLSIDEWYDSKPLTNKIFDNNDFIQSLADFLGVLHRPQTFTQVDRKRLPKINIAEYLTRYHQLALVNRPNEIVQINNLYQQSLPLIDFFCADTFCHNDLSLQNILLSISEQIKIIDWEYAGWGDPLLEIANLINSCDLQPNQENVLLAYYSKITNTIMDLEKLEKMKQLSIIVNRLWFLSKE